ncbi:hypothetical protein BZA05DRAFT_115705 [Tricharina praecox]|uniref:uncharacterized protein n=1 Tax=Tricharina praecox TaxID=43433 RepID=UPI002220242C|nr:uncharacterized protein BZA05DRAFT_115705 [Tricharina praecox]KAI5858114.1 hypothetical protein BZA05DRAFT_115705 [Tricharina praecox]
MPTHQTHRTRPHQTHTHIRHTHTSDASHITHHTSRITHHASHIHPTHHNITHHTRITHRTHHTQRHEDTQTHRHTQRHTHTHLGHIDTPPQLSTQRIPRGGVPDLHSFADSPTHGAHPGSSESHQPMHIAHHGSTANLGLGDALGRTWHFGGLGCMCDWSRYFETVRDSPWCQTVA